MSVSYTHLDVYKRQILYRDEMFKKLSMNVDDVFLMVDAKTARVDYVLSLIHI